MSDGAHIGVGAERALGTILGGEDQPRDDEKQTPAQMLDAIREAYETPGDYGACALSYARVLLEVYEKYPTLREQPLNPVYLRDGSGQMVLDGIVLVPDIYAVLKQIHSDEQCWQRLVMSDLTGFMVGWANNAVRYALGDPPVPNPAIITIPAHEG